MAKMWVDLVLIIFVRLSSISRETEKIRILREKKGLKRRH